MVEERTITEAAKPGMAHPSRPSDPRNSDEEVRKYLDLVRCQAKALLAKLEGSLRRHYPFYPPLTQHHTECFRALVRVVAPAPGQAPDPTALTGWKISLATLGSYFCSEADLAVFAELGNLSDALIALLRDGQRPDARFVGEWRKAVRNLERLAASRPCISKGVGNDAPQAPHRDSLAKPVRTDRGAARLYLHELDEQILQLSPRRVDEMIGLLEALRDSDPWPDVPEDAPGWPAALRAAERLVTARAARYRGTGRALPPIPQAVRRGGVDGDRVMRFAEVIRTLRPEQASLILQKLHAGGLGLLNSKELLYALVGKFDEEIGLLTDATGPQVTVLKARIPTEEERLSEWEQRVSEEAKVLYARRNPGYRARLQQAQDAWMASRKRLDHFFRSLEKDLLADSPMAAEPRTTPERVWELYRAALFWPKGVVWRPLGIAAFRPTWPPGGAGEQVLRDLRAIRLRVEQRFGPPPVTTPPAAGNAAAPAPAQADGPVLPQATGRRKRGHARDAGNRLKRDARLDLVLGFLKEKGVWDGTLTELSQSLQKEKGLKLSPSTLSRYLRKTGFAKSRGNPRRAAQAPGKHTQEHEAVSDEGPDDLSGADAWTMPDE